MNRRRALAALFFSVAAAATLGVVVYTEHSNAEQTLAVWVLTHDVAAGAPFSSGDVQEVRIPAFEAGVNYEIAGPGQLRALYVKGLRAQDVVRQDDLISASAVAEVALAVQNPPPLTPGESIDVFASVSGGEQARIGRDLTVVDVSGTSVDVLVPTTDESAWVTIGSSSVALHATRAAASADPSAAPLSVDEAIGVLCGSSCQTGIPSAQSSPP